jgi:hypothetical protein
MRSVPVHRLYTPYACGHPSFMTVDLQQLLAVIRADHELHCEQQCAYCSAQAILSQFAIVLKLILSQKRVDQ